MSESERVVNEQENSRVHTPSESPSISSPSLEKHDEQKTPEESDNYIPPAEMPTKPFSEYIFAYTCVLMIAFGGYVYGWDMGTVGGFVNMENWIRRMGQRHKDGIYYLSTVRMGLLVSIINIGALFGSLTFSNTADWQGRRPGLIIVTAVYIAGSIICITVHDKWYQYFIGRIVEGFGIGGIAVISPLMISEVSPKHIRGLCVSSYQLMITLGIFLGYCTNYGTDKYKSDVCWRVPLGLNFAWAVFMIIGMAFVPESPRFLLEKGRMEEGKRNLAKINKISVDDPSVTAEAEIILAAIEAERAAGVASWAEIGSIKTKVFQRVIMACMLQTCQQLTGVNYFFYYGDTVFKSVHVTNSFEVSVVFGVINFIMTFPSFYILDHYGRRICLILGGCWLAICFLIYACVGVKRLYVDGYGSATRRSAGGCLIAFSCFALAGFAPTWGPCVFVVISESFPIRVKAKSMALAQSCNYIWCFCIGFFTPMITKKIHFAYGYVFFGCIVFAIFYVFFTVPETKGLSLEEVESMWQEGVLPWKSVSWIPPSRRGADYDIDALKNDERPVWKRIL